MKEKAYLPILGEDTDSGDIIAIHCQVGDIVKEGDSICEIETDKATVDIPSQSDCKITEIVIKVGDTVNIGDHIISFERMGQDASEKDNQAATPPQQENAQPVVQSAAKNTKEPISENNNTTITIPVIGEGIDSVIVNKILVSAGDKIETGTTLFELESDKAAVDVPSEISGTIEAILVKEGDECNIGDVVMNIQTSSEANTTKNVADHAPSEKNMPAPETKTAPAENHVVSNELPVQKETKPSQSIKIDKKNLIPASPSIRRFAREIGIDINEVQGSGYRGRLSIDDVKNYSKAKNTNKSAVGSLNIDDKLPDFSQFGQIDVHKVNKIKQITAMHMKRSWLLAPRVTQFDEADITELEQLRKKYKEQYKSQAINITMTSILVKAIVFVLKEFPQFNSSFNEQKNQLIIKKYYNIGIAVDTEHGLLVPNIKDADGKNILKISEDLMTLSKKAKSRKLTPDESAGGSFTISNLGGIGGTQFTPIVNWPEAAILGVSKSTMQPVFKNDQFIPRLIMPLALSYDHRIVDGAEAARFLKRLVDILQEPFLMAYF